MSKKLMINVLLIVSSFAGCTVNFIGGCKLFKKFFKALRSYVKYHGRKPPSIYHLNNSSINLQFPWENYFGGSTGKNPTQRWAYEGANFVPIAVPIIWLNISSNKIKLLLFSTDSPASKINSLLNLIGIRFLYFVM